MHAMYCLQKDSIKLTLNQLFTSHALNLAELPCEKKQKDVLEILEAFPEKLQIFSFSYIDLCA